jgi:predicted PurR-regulated permease PerM
MLKQSLDTPMRRILLGVFFIGLMYLAWRVLGPFLVPVAWAGILAFITWPIYRRLQGILPDLPNLTATLMTLAVTALLVLPLFWLLLAIEGELAHAHRTVVAQLAKGTVIVPAELRNVPILGDWLYDSLQSMLADPGYIQVQLHAWVGQGRELLLTAVGGVGRNILKFALALLTLFFLYRDGIAVLEQLRRVLYRILGERVHEYFDAIGVATHAVVYGLLLTALAQGALAGIGYWGAGFDAPVLLGALTVQIGRAHV